MDDLGPAEPEPSQGETTIDDALHQAAVAYAAELNRLDPEAIPAWLAEVGVESRFWDDRTNLYSVGADRLEDAALVLATQPGDEDYLVVRWAGTWVVDSDPVDWEAVLEGISAGDTG